MSSEFRNTHGFERCDVTLSSWRTAPYSRWSFQNVRELVPTAEIRSATVQPETALAASPLLDQPLDTGAAGKTTARAFLDYAHTDGFVLLRRGEIVAEHYAAHSQVNAPHLVFSVSKSLTAVVSGILEAEGAIDPARPVTDYLPAAKGSVYGDCSYRDVLDMRVSLDFEEAYLDPDGAFARYRRAMLWNPAEPDRQAETLAGFLLTLKKADRPHGGPFYYASPNADMLGVIIEAATGRRFADLMSDLLWKPLGAKNDALITVDPIGTSRTAGGICVTPRDLARVGEMLRVGGTANGEQVVPKSWIDDMRNGGSHEAWAASEPTAMEKGRYRSQWYQTGDTEGSFCAIGIHGQWLWIDPVNETVIVKLSSQPNPLDDEEKHDNLGFFRAITRLAA
ncbi:MAG: serine hydrolase domain-containing protein [Allorhizobium sp.]